MRGNTRSCTAWFYDFSPDRLCLVTGLLELLGTSSSFCGSVCHFGEVFERPSNLLAPPTSGVPQPQFGAVRLRSSRLSTVIGFRWVGVLPSLGRLERSSGSAATVGEKLVSAAAGRPSFWGRHFRGFGLQRRSFSAAPRLHRPRSPCCAAGLLLRRLPRLTNQAQESETFSANFFKMESERSS